MLNGDKNKEYWWTYTMCMSSEIFLVLFGSPSMVAVRIYMMVGMTLFVGTHTVLFPLLDKLWPKLFGTSEGGW